MLIIDETPGGLRLACEACSSHVTVMLFDPAQVVRCGVCGLVDVVDLAAPAAAAL